MWGEKPDTNVMTTSILSLLTQKLAFSEIIYSTITDSPSLFLLRVWVPNYSLYSVNESRDNSYK